MTKQLILKFSFFPSFRLALLLYVRMKKRLKLWTD